MGKLSSATNSIKSRDATQFSNTRHLHQSVPQTQSKSLLSGETKETRKNFLSTLYSVLMKARTPPRLHHRKQTWHQLWTSNGIVTGFSPANFVQTDMQERGKQPNTIILGCLGTLQDIRWRKRVLGERLSRGRRK